MALSNHVFWIPNLVLLLLPTIYAAFEHDRTIYSVQQYSAYKHYSAQPDQWCVYGGCYTGGESISFNSIPAGGPDDFYIPLCANELLIRSVWQCSQFYCTLEQAKSTYHLLNDPCELYAGITLLRPEDALLSPAELNRVPRLNATEAFATSTNKLNNTALPNQDLFDIGFHTLKAFYTNWDLGATLGFSMVGFWGFVILVGMVHRLVEVIRKSGAYRQPGWWLWVRRTLIIPATFDYHQAESVAHIMTIPPRLETLVLTVFVIMNIVICFPGYDLFTGNIYYPDNNLQLARYIADRTGYFSIALLPMVWIFSARNNFLMWLTGWSFATFNRFHRWVARFAVLHAVIHSIAWTIYEVIYAQSVGMPKFKFYNDSYNSEYWYMGVIATVLMSVMLGASTSIIREATYDLFLILHIVLSVVFLVALWYHVRIFNGEFNYWLYCCIAVWAVDRILRFARTVIISVVPRLSKGVRAIVTYDCKTDMIRFDITAFMPKRPVIPGQFYYLYVPNGLRGYESHPFTLCSWHRAVSPTPATSAQGSFNKQEFDLDVQQVAEGHTAREVAHTLLVRPYQGMTGRLHDKLTKSHKAMTSTQETVFLEGPYGLKCDLSGYSDVLIICGGSGITAAVSHSHYLVSKTEDTRVHIIWAVPRRYLPDDICANELASVIHTDRVNMRVYLTDKAVKDIVAHDDVPVHVPYEVRLGRPNVQEIMQEYREIAQKSLAVVTCGTPQMSDACRRAVVRILGEGGVQVGYFNETSLW